MKIGVVTQVLGPLLQEGKLLQLRVSYVNEPGNSRPIWLLGFESGLAHACFSVMDEENGEITARLEDGWENVELWASFIVAHESDYQHKTRDELLIALQTAAKVHKSQRKSLFEMLRDNKGEVKVMQ